MASLAIRGTLFRHSLNSMLQLRLLHASPRLLAVPQGREREEFIDAGGASKKMQELESWAKETKESLSNATDRFRKAYDIYYGKDRDFENFPTLKQPASMPKVRLGFLPDSWFQAFYEKTGVTGPYLLALGIPTFLVSKEFWVLDPEGVVLLLLAPFAVFVTKRYGPKIKQIGETSVQKQNAEFIEKPIQKVKQEGANVISLVDKKIKDDTIVFEEAFKAKKENLDLQLEAEYRRRMSDAAKVVQRRMSFHAEMANAKRQVQQQHLINWVVRSVQSSITPQQEKAAVQQCISELKTLAAKSHA